MTTLYKRATPSQARILRAVEGAIKNAHDAHGREFDRRFARSIAKRAAGTLTAQWPEVLAAKKLPDLSLKNSTSEVHRHSEAQVTKPKRTASVSPSLRRSPLGTLEKAIFSQMRGIKLSGQAEKAAAFIEVLRMIAKLKSET